MLVLYYLLFALGLTYVAWIFYLAVMAAVKSGSRPMPALDELLAELPVLIWPI